jgi:hypothetical protein
VFLKVEKIIQMMTNLKFFYSVDSYYILLILKIFCLYADENQINEKYNKFELHWLVKCFRVDNASKSVEILDPRTH